MIRSPDVLNVFAAQWCRFGVGGLHVIGNNCPRRQSGRKSEVSDKTARDRFMFLLILV